MISRYFTHTTLKKNSSHIFKKSKKVDKSTFDKEATITVRLVFEEKFNERISLRLRKLSGISGSLSSDQEFEQAVIYTEEILNYHYIKIVKTNPRTRIAKLSGKAIDFEQLFCVKLEDYRYNYERPITGFGHEKTTMGHHSHLYIPKKWKGMIHSVVGLQHTPLEPQAVSSFSPLETSPSVSAAFGKSSDLWAEHYFFPSNTDGSGQHIGVIAAGGGFSQEDFDRYFKEVGLPNQPPYEVVLIDRAKNNMKESWIANYEVATDCLVASCAAPGAKITVYFCENNFSSFMNAIDYIIDQGDDRPDILSYSWGTGERYCYDEMEAVNRVLKEAALTENITIFCASGDFGSTNNGSINPANLNPRDNLEVLFPASSPWVTSCGGTMFEGDDDNPYKEETVWNCEFLYSPMTHNASGGGFSMYNYRPKYQRGIIGDLAPKGYTNPDWFDGKEMPPRGKERHEALVKKFKPFRGIPDVAGYASVPPARLGFWIHFDGRNWISGGTSAVAPLWAALTARLNQSLGKRVGFFNPTLYAMAGTDAFKPVTKGHNGLLVTNSHWVAGEPWNPCTGLGLPNGENILKWLQENFTEEKIKD